MTARYCQLTVTRVTTAKVAECDVGACWAMMRLMRAFPYPKGRRLAP